MNTTPANAKKLPLRPIILTVVSLVLFAGLLLLVNNLVTSWCISPLPGKAVNGCDATSDPQFNQATQSASSNSNGIDVVNLPTPVIEAPAMELPPTWDGASRVTVLLLGLDSSDGSPDRSGPARSDSMILLTIDPQTKTGGMLSIPRDLWVNVPGYGYGRINTAYMQGDAYKVPGGGPALAMKTVEQVIGVPVQYYAQIDFASFTRLIDDIDKIPVKVPKKIFIDPAGPGEDKIMLTAGTHMLGGVEALAYARQRHTEGGDVDRAQRQQQVLMGIRAKVLDPATFPTILANATSIYNEVQVGLHTNLTFDDMMKLGMLAKDIPIENIKRGVIDYTMVTQVTVTVNGQAQDIFKPMPDKIRVLRDEIFSNSGAISPLAKGADALDLAKQEAPTVAIYNGTYTTGLAAKTSDYLKSLGFNVVVADSATDFPAATFIKDHRGRPYALKYFQDLFKLNAAIQIRSDFKPEAAADIEIILGPDWAANNPMP
jgi:polyisoprenyl-teichoic acid--peptidoglycan teichoic acid transferase